MRWNRKVRTIKLGFDYQGNETNVYDGTIGRLLPANLICGWGGFLGEALYLRRVRRKGAITIRVTILPDSESSRRLASCLRPIKDWQHFGPAIATKSLRRGDPEKKLFKLSIGGIEVKYLH